MKKSLAVFGLLFLMTACAPTPSVPVVPTPPTPVELPDLQSYHNLPHGFSFQYPSEWGFGNADSGYSNLEEKIVQLELPQSAYPGTNFGDAAFTVSAEATDSLEKCLNLQSGAERQDAFDSKNLVVVDGVNYYKSEGVGAAAGNTYENKTYRAYQDTFCFEIAETLHTSNIGNYDPGTVTEVDEDAVWERLDAIFQSFVFDATGK